MCPFFCNHAAENVRKRDSLPDKVITNVWNIGNRNNEITGSRKQCLGATQTAFACWGYPQSPRAARCAGCTFLECCFDVVSKSFKCTISHKSYACC